MGADSPTVVGVGYNTDDHVCVVDGEASAAGKVRLRRYFRQPGGQVPTALVALQRWGVTTAYIGPLGDDLGGVMQRDSLRAEGVGVDSCPVCPGVPSQTSFITVDASGERTIQWYRDDRLRLCNHQVDDSLVTSARAVMLDGEESEVAIAVGRSARRAGVLVMLDIDEPSADIRRILAASDIAVVAAGFTEKFAPGVDLAGALRAICDCGPAVAVATLGSGGAVAWRDGRLNRQPAFPVRTVDTTSAGDVFHAAFLYATLGGEDMAEILRFASAAAAAACTKFGGRASIPDLTAIREQMTGATESR